MAFDLMLPLRIIQVIFAIIVLGLTAYVAHWYDHDTLSDSPSQINFLIFVSIFSLIAVAFLEATSRFNSKVSHPYARLAFEVLTTIFYFAGFIALAVWLGNLLFCQGTVCGTARAACVFAAFSFALWCVSTALLGMHHFGRGSSSSADAPMAQV